MERLTPCVACLLPKLGPPCCIKFTLRRVGAGQRTIGGENDWWDSIVGVRGRAMLTEKVYLDYKAPVGGFGVSSDFL